MAFLRHRGSVHGDLRFDQPLVAGDELSIQSTDANGEPAITLVPLRHLIPNAGYALPTVAFVDFQVDRFVEVFNPPPLDPLEGRRVDASTNRFVSAFHINRRDGTIRLSRCGAGFVAALLRSFAMYLQDHSYYGNMEDTSRIFIRSNLELQQPHAYSITILPLPEAKRAKLSQTTTGLMNYIFGTVLPRTDSYHLYEEEGREPVLLRIDQELRSLRVDIRNAGIGDDVDHTRRALMKASYHSSLWSSEKREQFYCLYDSLKWEIPKPAILERAPADNFWRLLDNINVVPRLGDRDWCRIASRSTYPELRQCFWHNVPRYDFSRRRYRTKADFAEFVTNFYRHPRGLSRRELDYQLCQTFPDYLNEFASVLDNSGIHSHHGG